MQKESFIARWSQFFITRYKTTILIIFALIVAGVFGVQNNQRQDFPSIASNFITVQAVWPGASSADVEQEVIIPIEQAIGDTEHVDTVRSQSRDNIGFLTIQMEDANEIETIAEDMQKSIDEAGLPTDVETEVEVVDVVGPSLVYALSSDNLSQAEMLTHAKDVEERFENASNELLRVDVTPSDEFEVAVALNAKKMEDKGVTYQDVSGALSSALTAIPGGALDRDSGETLSITIDPAITSLEELRKTRVGNVKLTDVATVERVPTEEEVVTLAGFVDENGPQSGDAVYLFAYKKDDGDVINMSADIAAEVERIKEENVLPEGVQLVTLYDNSVDVQGQITDLLNNGWLGLILILLVLMLFINFRTGVVVALIIPMAFLGTLAILYAIGFSINILTLFALILVLGILVDNAIVIAEGVTHAIEAGKTRAEATRDTMRNLGPAVTAATLTTVVVFIPFASIGGIIGDFLKYIPYTIIIMLLMSYGLAITIMPVLARYFLKEQTKEERRSQKLRAWQYVLVVPALVAYGQRLIDWLEDIYGRFTDVLHARWWSKGLAVIAALGLIVGSMGTFASQLDVEQFPSDDTNLMQMDFEFPSQMGFDERLDVMKEVMDVVVATDQFDSYYVFEGQVFVLFERPDERTTDENIFDLQDDIEQRLEPIAARLEKKGVYARPSIAGVGPPGGTFDITVELRGESVEDLRRAAADLEEFVASQEGVDRVTNSAETGLVDSISVDVLDKKVRDSGVDAAIVAAAVSSTFGEREIGTVVNSDSVSEAVQLSYQEQSTKTVKQLKDVVVGVAGSPIPTPVTLDDVADVEEQRSLGAVARLDGLRVATVQVLMNEDVEPTDVENAIKERLTDEHLEQFGLSAEDVEFGGIEAQNAENFESLQLVFMLAIIAVYLILVYQFNSFMQPLMILFTIPMALIGVFPGLVGVGSSINMISGLGIIALVGIVVNDAIVFVDYYNRIRRDHPEESLREVVVKTGRARFKPILSTSITTIFGILPLTVTDPFWRGLGTSLITGLVCSTIGTLIVFPVLLSWLSQLSAWIGKTLRNMRKRMQKA